MAYVRQAPLFEARVPSLRDTTDLLGSTIPAIDLNVLQTLNSSSQTPAPYGVNRMMHATSASRTSFKLRHRTRRLDVSGMVPKNECSSPSEIDETGEPYLMVVKQGATTGLTIGRLNGTESVTRFYGTGETVPGNCEHYHTRTARRSECLCSRAAGTLDPL